MRPQEINILGKTYTVTYHCRPSDVDLHRRESLWGQIDYWTRSIRIYDPGPDERIEDVLHNLLHEILHGIAEELKISQLSGEENHEALDLLALALADTLNRNGWLRNVSGTLRVPSSHV